MSLNMSGPRMTLAPLIRVLVSSDGSWSKQPRLVFKNIEVMDSRAHLSAIHRIFNLHSFQQSFTCRCVAKCPRQQNLLSYIQNFISIKEFYQRQTFFVGGGHRAAGSWHPPCLCRTERSAASSCPPARRTAPPATLDRGTPPDPWSSCTYHHAPW